MRLTSRHRPIDDRWILPEEGQRSRPREVQSPWSNARRLQVHVELKQEYFAGSAMARRPRQIVKAVKPDRAHMWRPHRVMRQGSGAGRSNTSRAMLPQLCGLGKQYNCFVSSSAGRTVPRALLYPENTHSPVFSIRYLRSTFAIRKGARVT